MNGCIGENAVGLDCGRLGPTTFANTGAESPIATSRTPRPGEGRDDETTRRPPVRWFL